MASRSYYIPSNSLSTLRTCDFPFAAKKTTIHTFTPINAKFTIPSATSLYLWEVTRSYPVLLWNPVRELSAAREVTEPWLHMAAYYVNSCWGLKTNTLKKTKTTTGRLHWLDVLHQLNVLLISTVPCMVQALAAGPTKIALYRPVLEHPWILVLFGPC